MSPSQNRFRKSSSKDHPRPKKSLGQNFLIDRSVIGRIIEACSFSKEDAVLEIGPGTAALTREIAPRVGSLTVVETDRNLVERLEQEFKHGEITIVHGDFLRYDLAQIAVQGKLLKAVGNLPYYISTPIITKIIESRRLFGEFYLTVQQELADRMVAPPGNKEYGSFSCFVQYYAQAQVLLKIKSSAFKPMPKVDSCFLKLTMRSAPAVECRDEEFLFKVVRTGFQQRRKTLLNALSSLISKDRLSGIFSSLGFDPNVRAEQLGLAQYALLSDAISKVGSKQ
jgi:16S rRNA (adenine1518-N6/adenine1519-N6)-dimethyltransferase